jgi:hypothetical protein
MADILSEKNLNDQRDKDPGRRHPASSQIKARVENSIADVACTAFCCHHSPDWPNCLGRPPTQIKARDEESSSEDSCAEVCSHHSPDFPLSQLCRSATHLEARNEDSSLDVTCPNALNCCPPHNYPQCLHHLPTQMQARVEETSPEPTERHLVHRAMQSYPPRACPLTPPLCTGIKALGMTPNTDVDFATWERLGNLVMENTKATKREPIPQAGPSSIPRLPCPLLDPLCAAIEAAGLTPETDVDLGTWKNLSLLAMEIQQGTARRDIPQTFSQNDLSNAPPKRCPLNPPFCKIIQSHGMTPDVDVDLATWKTLGDSAMELEQQNTRRDNPQTILQEDDLPIQQPNLCPLHPIFCEAIQSQRMTPKTEIDFATWKSLGESAMAIQTQKQSARRYSAEDFASDEGGLPKKFNRCPLIVRFCKAIESQELTPDTDVDFATWNKLGDQAWRLEQLAGWPGWPDFMPPVAPRMNFTSRRRDLTKRHIPCPLMPDLCQAIKSQGMTPTADIPLATWGSLASSAMANQAEKNANREIRAAEERDNSATNSINSRDGGFGPRPAPKMPKLPCPKNAKRCYNHPPRPLRAMKSLIRAVKSKGNTPEVIGDEDTIFVGGPPDAEELKEGGRW